MYGNPLKVRVPSSAVLAVVVSTFFLGFGGGVVFPILPDLGTIIGITPLVVGLILSVNRIVRLIANAPAGVLVDRIGTRKPFIAGVVLETAATFGYVIAMYAPTPAAWFFGTRVLWGLGSAFVLATAYTIAANVSEHESRGSTMGLVRGATSLGFPAGMALGGVVSEFYGTVIAFEAAAGLSVAATLIAIVAIPETHADHRSERASILDINVTTSTLVIGGTNFGLLFTYSGVVFATLVSFLKTTDAAAVVVGPQGTYGVLIGTSVLIGSICSIAGGKLSDTLSRRMPVIVSCLIVLALGVLVLASANTFLSLFLAMALLGVGQGGVGGPLLSLLGDQTNREQLGRATGTYNVLGDLGAAVGLLVSPSVAELIGFRSLYAVTVSVPLIAVGLILVYLLSERESVQKGHLAE
ncbi:MFS transporter [Haladaptatus sp. AB618]|uniref:MFS transporter n=1 Tax=Haladaptatus sp. AB618 TaxID=2934173 RepID=UPI00209C56ED|nr:MFS transporter [Haladaptatus sp. AB618]MCO8255691.1 MFS transporter [Haladaptatus sp. AB618]